MVFGRRSALLLLCLAARAGCVEMRVSEGMWSPNDLDAVDGALKNILKLHLTPEVRKKAEKVADDVHKDIAAQTDKSLTADAKHKKVGEALGEMKELAGELSKPLPEPDNLVAMDKKLAGLKKELAEKQALMAKDESEIKLFTLQKELAEKKLQLAKLVEMKMKSANGKAADSEDAKARKEIVAKLETLAKDLAAAKTKNGDKEETSILADLQKREGDVKASIDKLDAADKKDAASLDSMTKASIPTLGKGDALEKGQRLIKMLRKKEHRQYKQVRALKKAELAELQAAIASIKKGDAKALQKTVQKMENELKSFSNQPGGFLH